MAELMGISPESFSPKEKLQILTDMVAASSAIEDAMRDDFSRLDEVTQTRLLDAMAEEGRENRDFLTI